MREGPCSGRDRRVEESLSQSAKDLEFEERRMGRSGLGGLQSEGAEAVGMLGCVVIWRWPICYRRNA